MDGRIGEKIRRAQAGDVDAGVSALGGGRGHGAVEALEAILPYLSTDVLNEMVGLVGKEMGGRGHLHDSDSYTFEKVGEIRGADLGKGTPGEIMSGLMRIIGGLSAGEAWAQEHLAGDEWRRGRWAPKMAADFAGLGDYVVATSGRFRVYRVEKESEEKVRKKLERKRKKLEKEIKSAKLSEERARRELNRLKKEGERKKVELERKRKELEEKLGGL